MKLSVITINFNNRQGLEKTFKSVFAQSFCDFEYLVIDGGSTDGSVEVITNYEKRITKGELPDRTFRWVSEPDNGIYHAMNKAIAKSRGEYCYFLNSGDALAADDVLAKIFADGCTESFICGNYILDQKGILEYNSPYKYRDWRFSLYDIYSGFLAHQAFFIKREMFDKYSLYDESLRIMSDWKLFFIAIGINGESVDYKDVFISIYDTEGLSSRIGGKVLYEEKLKVAQEELSPQLAQKLDRLYYLECNDFWVDFIHSKKWIHFLFKVFLKVGKWLKVVKIDE
jgi:glycosyltransferase involved in cell wall biosynthesis